MPPTLRGILLITAAGLGFSCMHGIIRHLSAELHPFEIAFFRNAFGLVALLPFFLRHGPTVLRTEKLFWQLARGSLHVVAMLMFFAGLTLVPLARVSALSFTSPLFATLGAILILGEAIRLRRVVALVLGFGGALLIVGPGAVTVDAGALLVLGSSAMWALTMLIIKYLTRTDTSLTTTAYMGLVMTPLSLLPALLFWRWPSASAYPWLAVMGLVGVTSQYAMAEAFRRADATAILPFDFSRLLWASAIGYLFFGEIPAITTWLGGGIIFTSSSYIAYREARTRAVEEEPTTQPVASRP